MIIGISWEYANNKIISFRLWYTSWEYLKKNWFWFQIAIHLLVPEANYSQEYKKLNWKINSTQIKKGIFMLV